MFLNLEGDAQQSDDDRDLEATHFNECVLAFLNYAQRNIAANKKRRSDILSLPSTQTRYLKNLPRKIAGAEQRINANAAFLEMLANENITPELLEEREKPVLESNADKVRSTLRQFVRDWSEEGKPERDATYTVILDELEARFQSVPVEERGKINVLVPGAGLGRLAFEVVSRGFSCEGNEFSFYMLLGSHYVLNRTRAVNEVEIFPFIHTFSNVLSVADQLQGVRIPDVLPAGGIPPTANFSMAAGDFCEVYAEPKHKENWDVIVTCFFVDTAKNIVEYVDIISSILKKGGVWINLGPLYWHWEGTPNEMSVELSLEEFKDLVHDFGFVIENERMVNSTYTGNPRSMLSHVYKSVFFTAVKQ